MGRKKSDKPKLSWRMQQFIKNPRGSRIRTRRICREEKLSEDFMRQYADYLNWYDLSQHQQMSEEFCKEFLTRVDWRSVLNRGLISEQFLRNYKDEIKWEVVSNSSMPLSIDFLREFKDQICWKNYSFSIELSWCIC